MIKHFFWILLTLLLSCKEKNESPVHIKSPKKQSYQLQKVNLSEKEYYDKILGALVGSAIGDAMGASTEMWNRNDIRVKYGYITSLTPAVRPQSPEGTWDHNLLPGATTDDTRWKLAMVKYLTRHGKNLSPKEFSRFINNYYHSLTESLNTAATTLHPDSLDLQIEKIDWIKEWARVSMAYQSDAASYEKALHRFYGGEMSCAGQLYTPMFGLVTHTAEEAYNLAYDHAIFDIGYAKDISALVSAMTHVALKTQQIDSIINTATFVDPLGYQDSRLVGRIAYNIADVSVKNVLQLEHRRQNDTLNIKLVAPRPANYPFSEQDWAYQEMLYEHLERDEKAIPFHSGEIWQILITALQFGQGDFEKTLQFIVNYGRDNDTVAAVAGMILGAKDGYSNLPPELRTEILRVNKEHLGIDLQALARELTNKPSLD